MWMAELRIIEELMGKNRWGFQRCSRRRFSPLARV